MGIPSASINSQNSINNPRFLRLKKESKQLVSDGLIRIKKIENIKDIKIKYLIQHDPFNANALNEFHKNEKSFNEDVKNYEKITGELTAIYIDARMNNICRQYTLDEIEDNNLQLIKTIKNIKNLENKF